MAQTVLHKVISTSINFLFLKSCDTSLLKIRRKSSRISDMYYSSLRKKPHALPYIMMIVPILQSWVRITRFIFTRNPMVRYGALFFFVLFFLPTYLCAFPFKLFFCSLHVWSNLLCPSAIYLQKPQKGSLKLQQ